MVVCTLCGADVSVRNLIKKPLSQKCKHTMAICLECASTSSAFTGSCSYPGCKETVPAKNELFTRYPQLPEIPRNNVAEILPCNNVPKDSIDWEGPAALDFEMMTGMNMKMTLKLQNTVIEVKCLLQHATNIIEERQKLLCNSVELTDNLPDGTVARLGDHKVRANDKIMLVKIMLELPTQNEVSLFDLFWGYPKQKRVDYLDATCLVFAGDKHVAVVDYNHKTYGQAIKHSGDIMDNKKRIGHHTMELNVKKLPENVTHIFFILSSWESDNIAAFLNPNLRFYDIKKPKIDLCSTNFTHAMNSQAVIMSSLSRTRGKWQIFESGKISDGNAKNYKPLVASIQSLIKCGV